MPAVSGVSFVISLANVKQQYTVSGSGTYHLVFDGQETGDLTEASSASAIETALEALSNVGANEVAVSGTAPGPYTVEFGGGSGTKFAGQDVTLLEFKVVSGTPSATVTKLTPAGGDYFSVAGQRGATLNRGIDTADAADKDAPGWPNELPVKRNWSIDFDNLIIETDAGAAALEDAWQNKMPVHVRVTTPGANTYSGSGTLEGFAYDGPHDGLFIGTGSIVATTALTKA